MRFFFFKSQVLCRESSCWGTISLLLLSLPPALPFAAAGLVGGAVSAAAKSHGWEAPSIQELVKIVKVAVPPWRAKGACCQGEN